MPRFFCDATLAPGAELALPPGAARHVQVLRLQPGDEITLFNGQGGQWTARVRRMGRSDVAVRVEAHEAIDREAAREVTLAIGMPANERMDWLVEKATELGVARIAPLHTQHGVLRLSGERAAKKQAHWRAIAQAACEQCGRNRVPTIEPVCDFAAFLHEAQGARVVLSLAEGGAPAPQTLGGDAPLTVLIGPEGGLSAAEDAQARTAGFAPTQLGARVLRAETAALAALTLALA
ncbi:16S rRNA (uracil(1498)-N(3))-methyltransferase [Hydrogenophaga intermedia]|uniref:Ribosomal RNA small subunit methyltransferase E n=1 Tax=Hydrogenophaga intermedia TaxID=65786 RepID=A0A1L1PVK3_HYDIT|nr:16S rRNA (uracil(1498)-N(3))-methyltransferase [Hydrogenophaga intermedia]TMU73074.1 16S rRNA (uracil(1498)-N(3))-methyltransferase [Hydrogenophaga intermedia]CDN88641.1 Ribosomal RNA small subunit methyltransferase E [Hydrogenophaga intermedia]